MNHDAHVQVIHKAIKANGEKNDANIINMFCFYSHYKKTRLFLLGKLVKKSPIVTMFNLTKVPLDLVFFTVVFLTNSSLANLIINFE